MYNEKEIPIYDFVCVISETLDLVVPALSGHHKKVAIIACRIAQSMNIPDEEIQYIILASMLHDVGAFSAAERLKIQQYNSFEEGLDEHAIRGSRLLKGFAPFSKVAKIIQYHHANYDPLKRSIPLGSYIVHLADRISVLPDERLEILGQVPEILENIRLKKHQFHPDILAAFINLSKLECFWIEAFLPSANTSVLKKALFSKKIIGVDILKSFAKVLSQLIDFRTGFTATHSSGVAAVARDLAAISGFSERECKLMEIAGLLHDIGKLAVPNEILEKNGKLNKEEFNVIKKHTFYTHSILSKITGLEEVAIWASYHHERLDGNGYPFHVKGEDFSKLARIMAVADTFTALTEDRPYRLGMNKEQSMEVLFNMAKYGGIDKNLIGLANNNFFRINEIRVKAQKEERKDYNNFQKTVGKLFDADEMQSA